MMLSPLKQEVKESEAISLIYISIPFCKYLCHFCTFARQFGKELFHIQKLKTRYLQTIKKELAVKSATATAKHKVDLKGIHFGGGTPSLLEVEDFAGILSAIEELFHQDVRKIQEVGLEANPDSLTLEKLRGLKSLGFNRISMGLQTFNPDILKRINRQHSVEQFYQAYEWARQAGFENINIDLIYGIPEQTFADVEKDLETVVNLDPDHIAPSPLLPVQSPLFRIGPDEELKRKTMTREWAPHVDRFLRDKGYANYLHKNYAKQNRENITQLTYFYYVPYIGTGAAADSITGHNLDEIESYLEAPLAAKTLLREEKYWDPLQAARNMIMFPEGIDLPYFKRRFDRDLEELLEESQFDAAFNRNQSQEWFREGIFEIEGDHLRIAPQARFSKEGWLFYMTSV